MKPKIFLITLFMAKLQSNMSENVNIVVKVVKLSKFVVRMSDNNDQNLDTKKIRFVDKNSFL